MKALRPHPGRALLLTHVLPDPCGVGLARRAWRWVEELSGQHALEILVVSPHQQAPPPHPLPGTVRFVHGTGRPLASRHLADWFDPDAAVAHALSGLSGPPPERIVVFRLFMHDVAACLPPAWRGRAEIDCDDWEAATRLSLAAIAFRQGRYGLARRRLSEAARYAVIERKVLPTYRRVHVAAVEDAAGLRRLTGIRHVQASLNKIAIEAGFAPTPRADGSRTLLFVGALFYPPNEDAMLWFGAAVLPHLRRLVKDVRVVAAGRAEESLQRRLARDGIDYVHAPRDLRPIYAGAAAVIAPLRGGGGTKLKVLEAWLHERPLVATSHAARGLAAEAGRHFLVADRPLAFARACAAVLQDRELADRLVAAGRDLLQARYRIEGPDATVGVMAQAGEG